MYSIKKLNEFDIINIKQKNINVSLMNYGATIKQIQTPNSDGVFEDLLLEYKNTHDYLNNSIYLNATIGPIAGRIRDGKLNVLDHTYRFSKNQDNKHTLHSGNFGLSFNIFSYEISDDDDDTTRVKFQYQESNEANINYKIIVTYTIKNGQIEIDYQITPNHPFIFNVTNHAYFNLSGNLKRDIKNHILQINTSKRHELDDDSISTNKIIDEPIYDFSSPKKINDSLTVLKNSRFGGFDDIYFYPNSKKTDLKASVYDPLSERTLEVYSTYDHMVFYSHNNVNDSMLKHLDAHKKHYALCFECQKSPIDFKHPDAKDLLIKENDTYNEKIIFNFGIKTK